MTRFYRVTIGAFEEILPQKEVTLCIGEHLDQYLLAKEPLPNIAIDYIGDIENKYLIEKYRSVS